MNKKQKKMLLYDKKRKIQKAIFAIQLEKYLEITNKNNIYI